ncbi:hypothetical protein L1987_44598 [Smallanthus sonchifolius]|uniref:Uncharacterized protein n=1 Tax=Smallanthus sonchifolius TaxID=185202 RepID=A0ACB9GR65_9ASTR|nr:hypothetical protein L1987_44598 [Smallanthus sonchifolius]
MCKDGGRQLIRCPRNKPNLESYAQNRFFRSIASAEAFSPSCQPVGCSHEVDPLCLQNTHFSSIVQRRGFLGCSDGDQGGTGLSKVHEEKCILGYSPEQMYAVVAAVDMYQDFLPWCRRSDIVRRHADGSFDAELEIGFKFLVESYVSHVKLMKPKLIKTTSSQSNLFDHLINISIQDPLQGRVTSIFFGFQVPVTILFTDGIHVL